jgi:hypothetical protein
MTKRLRRLALAALTVAAAAAGAAPQSFSVELAGGRVKGGNETLKVRQGDQVEVRVSSDKPIVLHLHGYNIETQVAPPAPGLLTFEAKVAGRFPMHEHRQGAGNHRAVMFIEVRP